MYFSAKHITGIKKEEETHLCYTCLFPVMDHDNHKCEDLRDILLTCGNLDRFATEQST